MLVDVFFEDGMLVDVVFFDWVDVDVFVDLCLVLMHSRIFDFGVVFVMMAVFALMTVRVFFVVFVVMVMLFGVCFV